MAVKIVGDIDRKIWEESKNCTQSHCEIDSGSDIGSDNDGEMKFIVNVNEILMIIVVWIVILNMDMMVIMGTTQIG